MKYVSTRPIRARLRLERKTNGISFAFARAPSGSHKELLWVTIGDTVAEVTKREHPLVMMEDNPRAGARKGGCVDNDVLGAFEQDTPNDNGRGLMAFSAGDQHALANTFSAAPNLGILYTFQN